MTLSCQWALPAISKSCLPCSLLRFRSWRTPHCRRWSGIRTAWSRVWGSLCPAWSPVWWDPCCLIHNLTSEGTFTLSISLGLPLPLLYNYLFNLYLQLSTTLTFSYPFSLHCSIFMSPFPAPQTQKDSGPGNPYVLSNTMNQTLPAFPRVTNTYGSYQDANIPFPRTSGVRFCGAGKFHCLFVLTCDQVHSLKQWLYSWYTAVFCE